MNDYEILLEQVYNEVPVLEGYIRNRYDKEGLYRDGKIYIDKNLPLIRKREILAEEYGHHKTSVGNILNLNSIENSKQETKARDYGVEILVTLDDLIDCALSDLHSNYDCAEYLGVTEDYFEEVLEYYYRKYGLSYKYKDYILYFDENCLTVAKAEEE